MKKFLLDNWFWFFLAFMLYCIISAGSAPKGTYSDDEHWEDTVPSSWR
jgi:hypothetical protein